MYNSYIEQRSVHFTHRILAIAFKLFLCYSFVTLVAASEVPLKWDNTVKTIDTAPVPRKTSYDLEYHFTNTGDSSVRIISAKTSCGCMIVQIGNDEYAPGESGVLRVKYNVSNPRNAKSRKIVVETDFGYVFLEARVSSNQRAFVDPDMMSWTIKQGRQTQVATLETQINGSISAISSSDTEFEVDAKEVTPGRKYQIFVTPKSATKPMRALINVEVLYVDGTRQSYGIVAKCQ
jgi:hypothetical protein